MAEANTRLGTRGAHAEVAVIEVAGELTSGSGTALLAAYYRCEPAGTVVLDLTSMGYINSGGIGVLVTLLAATQRDGRRLVVSGLSPHHRQLLELARLGDTIEVAATGALAGPGVPRSAGGVLPATSAVPGRLPG